LAENEYQCRRINLDEKTFYCIGQGILTEGEGSVKVDLLVYKFISAAFILKIPFTFVTKQAALMRRSTVLKPSLSVRFPCIGKFVTERK
jgi:hypothetical protein